MNTPRPRQPTDQRGFTLVECIIVIVVLAIASVGIAAMQGNIFNGQASLKDLQVRTRLMEGCAEQVLAIRRFTLPLGYLAVDGANPCGNLATVQGYAVPTVTITAYTGAACPSTYTCKLASITQNGMTPLTLMLVDY